MAPLEHAVDGLFNWLEAQLPDDPERLGRLEFLYARPPRQLFKRLAADPQLFAELVSHAYPPEEGEEVDPAWTEQSEERSSRVRALLLEWDGHPGSADSDAARREQTLGGWSRAALQATVEQGRPRAGVIEVARVLARAPAAADGIWPCVTARKLIEQHPEHPELGDTVATSRVEGPFAQGIREGGHRARQIAGGYRSDADALRAAPGRQHRSLPRPHRRLDRLERTQARSVRRVDQDDRCAVTRRRLHEARSVQEISRYDVQEYPHVSFPYGPVPITHVSASVRRILGVAYMMLWSLHEHRENARGSEAPAERMVLLIDEVEAHLHPRWQRRVLSALLDAADELDPTPDVPEVQLVAVTHSPLVMASVEPWFDEEKDGLFVFEIAQTRQGMSLDRAQWHKRGEVSLWLKSIFGLGEARSYEAEQAIERAIAAPGAEWGVRPLTGNPIPHRRINRGRSRFLVERSAQGG